MSFITFKKRSDWSRSTPRWAVWPIVVGLVAVGIWGHFAFQAPEVAPPKGAYDPQANAPAQGPNYTQIETLLTMGGQVSAPPPGTQAILNLSLLEDPFIAPANKWSPIPDADPAPSLNWLREQVDFVDAQIRVGHAIFVHCDAGISRSAMVVVAYEMRRRHLDVDQALAYVKQRRPIIRPNAAFVALLDEWQRSITEDMHSSSQPASATTQAP